MAFTSFHGPDFTFDSLSADAGPLQTQLAAWHARAVAAGRVPCVYLTARWCPPSVQLEKSLVDPRMQHALRETAVASFDIDAWSEPLMAAGFNPSTVPVFFLIDADGKPTGPKITGAAWKENTPENMAPPLERFFDAARAARPTRPAPPVMAPPTAAAAGGGSRVGAVLMLVAAVALLAVGAWLKVSSDDKAQKDQADAELRKKIADDVARSVQQSM